MNNYAKQQNGYQSQSVASIKTRRGLAPQSKYQIVNQRPEAHPGLPGQNPVNSSIAQLSGQEGPFINSSYQGKFEDNRELVFPLQVSQLMQPKALLGEKTVTTSPLQLQKGIKKGEKVKFKEYGENYKGILEEEEEDGQYLIKVYFYEDMPEVNPYIVSVEEKDVEKIDQFPDGVEPMEELIPQAIRAVTPKHRVLYSPKGPLIHAVTMPGEIIQVLSGMIDFIYSRVPMEMEFSAIMHAVDSNGFGDLLFGLKATRLLQDAFPKAEIMLVSDSKDKILKLGGDVEYGVPVLGEEEVLTAPNLLITAPVTDLPINKLAGLRKEKSVSLLDLDEYGYGPKNVKPKSDMVEKGEMPLSSIGFSGLYATEMGILIEPSLSSYAEKLAKFTLGSELQLAFKRKHLADLQDKSLAETLMAREDQPLYFSYVHEQGTFNRFLNIIIAMITGQHSGADIVLPRNKKMAGIALRFIQKYEGEKFGNIQLVVPGVEVTSFQEAEGDTLRIICPDQATHLDMLTLLKASEPLVAVTGDQSISEAISADKVIIYEVIRHKKKFYDSVLQVANVVAPEIGSVISTVMEKGKTNEIAGLLLSGDAQRAFSAFSAYIRANHDMTKQLVGRVKRLMLHRKFPELREAEDRLIKQAVGVEDTGYTTTKLWKVVSDAAATTVKSTTPSYVHKATSLAMMYGWSDREVERRYLLGEFDDEEPSPKIPFIDIDSEEALYEEYLGAMWGGFGAYEAFEEDEEQEKPLHDYSSTYIG